MFLLLPTMVEGGGCAVMVGAGVMVGVGATTMAEGGVEGAAPGEKRERRIIIILYNSSYYSMSSKIKSICAHQHSYTYYRRQLHVLQYI